MYIKISSTIFLAFLALLYSIFSFLQIDGLLAAISNYITQNGVGNYPTALVIILALTVWALYKFRIDVKGFFKALMGRFNYSTFEGLGYKEKLIETLEFMQKERNEDKVKFYSLIEARLTAIMKAISDGNCNSDKLIVSQSNEMETLLQATGKEALLYLTSLHGDVKATKEGVHHNASLLLATLSSREQGKTQEAE